MFIDIKGFTAMTQDLMNYGKEGVEILSGIINEIFTPAINEVYANHGFISSFAGDAFTSIFPIKQAEYVLKTAFEIQDLFTKYGIFHTRFGNYTLRVKIGLSSGNVQYRIIDAGCQMAYYFKGIGIDGCCMSEKLAGSMQIIADDRFFSKISKGLDHARIHESHYLLSPKILHLDRQKKQNKNPVPDGIESLFVPESLLDLNVRGEFREVVSCFISFQGRTSNEFIKGVINRCHSYGGYFNRVDFGDKGGVMLILFGAPSAREKLYERALDFALGLGKLSRVKFRAGITAGTAFAGFIGSEKRSEYTALGSNVNLSARLMTKAGWYEILTDRKISEKLSGSVAFNLKDVYDINGFKVKVEAYIPGDKISNTERILISRCFLGRESEELALKKILKPVFKKSFAGLIYIDGPAGIGKSVFIRNFDDNLKGCRFLYLQCDEILKKSFNPFIYLLKKYFTQSDYNTDKQNRFNFSKIYKELISKIPDHNVKAELERTESVIAALTGVNIPNSMYSLLNEKDRYDNTIYAVKNFLIAQTLFDPVALVFEDAHWIDKDSITLIKTLIRNVDRYPLAVLVICRNHHDGRVFELFDCPDSNVRTARLEIKGFSKDDIRKLLSSIKKDSKITDNTLEFVWEKSEGNPFYAEQILLYMHEKNMSGTDLRNRHDILPSSINQIIMARIDRLSSKTKDIIKAASVLGMEFALILLKSLLEKGKIIINENEYQYHLQIGYKEQIWDNIADLYLIFRHTLIRDAVYEMQLQERIRILHNMAGHVMEELYSSNPEKYYEELANHFVRGENRDKACFYLWKSAEKSKSVYHNEKALEYYEILQGYYQNDSSNLAKILLQKGHILEITGRLNSAGEAFRKALYHANKSGNKDRIIDCMNKIGWFYGLRNEPGKAKKILFRALKKAEEIGSKPRISMLLGNIGTVYLDESKYQEALEYFQKDLSIGKVAEPDTIDIPINNIGLTYLYQGNHKKAIEFFEKALRITERKSDKNGMARAMCNIGTAYHYQENLKEAAEFYERSIQISEEYGFKRISGAANGNIGSIYFMMDEYEKALKYFLKRLEIARELDDKFGIASALGNMGIIYTILGKFQEGMDLIQKKLNTCIAIGHKKGECTALSDMAIIHWHNKDYQYSLKSFEESIKIARKMNFRYELCEILSASAEMLYENGMAEEALDQTEEAMNIAQEYQRKDIMFNTSVMKLLLDKDIKGLKHLLKSQENYRNQARINHALWIITRERYIAEKTLKMYESLYSKVPKYVYKKVISEIKNDLKK